MSAAWSSGGFIGYREVPLTAQVMWMLADRAAAASRERGREFVFVAPRGNHWRYADFYRDRWVKIRDRAQEKGRPRRVTMHGLRHSLLTLLATEGTASRGGGVDGLQLRQQAAQHRVRAVLRGRSWDEPLDAADELAAPAYDVLTADELDELIAGLEPIAAAAQEVDD
ncbi:hypothetical protein Nm8I071_36950 [Nonomuraea sp. TT08I-71]|nr:hypothetical protein Nm8I071_36950 [Nonomuraea sp. TT08I-71]